MYTIEFQDLSRISCELNNPRIGEYIIINNSEFVIYKIIHNIDIDEVILKVKQ